MFRSALLLCLLALLVPRTEAQPPAGYYDRAEGLSGEPLRQALHGIISGHTPMDFNTLWTWFKTSDRRPDGKVWDMYSDIPDGTPPYLFTFGTDQCGTYTHEGACYNREHSFPKNWFGGDVPPMNTDLFHIYPTDGYVNNQRGDLPFGKVGSPDYTSQNGSKIGRNITSGYGGTVFEPIDAYKGDFARSYLYMLTRYWGQTGNWNSPMLSSGDFTAWAASLLLTWHMQDPVSQKETDRNNYVYSLQHNRNPYIDHPEWVQRIWGPTAGVDEADLLPVRIQNDAAGLHIIGTNGTLAGEVRVLDTTGRLVARSAVRGERTDVTLDVPGGLYVAEVVLPEGRRVQRFVR
ncbi:MAG: endonuclease [Flavobacteriales bacterium]